jgi:hypothetical protein
MRSATIIAVALVAYGLSACVSVLSPKPPDPQRSHIGIAIRVWAPIPFLPGAISQVYFARLEENQQDLLSRVPLIASNCNFPPNVPSINNFKGTYYRYAVVVALQGGDAANPQAAQCDIEEAGADPPAIGSPVGGPQPLRGYTFFFSKQLIRLTDVTVRPGTMVFMGDYSMDSSVWFTDGDEPQRYYAERLATAGFSYRGSLREVRRDKKAEEQFLVKSKERLREAGWEAMIEHRLDVLRKSP